MAAAPINRILTGLAVADLLVTLEYVPFACHMYVALPARHNYPWAVYMLFHACFTQVLHTISICITLTLAVWRYLAIRYPDRTHALCTQQRSHVAIGASYALALVVCAPNYVASEIQETCAMEVQPPVMGFVLAYKVRPRNEVLNRVNFWVYSVVIKLLPCGILGLLSGLFGDCFFFKCYQIFGELMDALALLNGAINFILYCSMSRQFRTTFGQLFKPRLLAKWSTPSHTTEVQSTYV
ncbi:uncharacterized protein GBIM_16221 [Gryllus bimaculatus]|nr:uncharacterized protein GBIM_16221 [Gryllus bimaculatus]